MLPADGACRQPVGVTSTLGSEAEPLGEAQHKARQWVGDFSLWVAHYLGI